MEYGVKEVPNIRLVFLDKGTQVRTIDIDTVIEYNEEIDKNETDCTIKWAIINPLDYEFILNRNYTDILMYRSIIMRSFETGEDELYFPPSLHFNRIIFEHYVEVGGEPVQWTIRLIE